MGSGLAQVGVILALTVIGLPLFFFGLMSALDRFEQALERAPRKVALRAEAPSAASVPSLAAANSVGAPASVSSKSTSAATI